MQLLENPERDTCSTKTSTGIRYDYYCMQKPECRWLKPKFHCGDSPFLGLLLNRWETPTQFPSLKYDKHDFILINKMWIFC